jgi:hypothetical protein
VFVELVELAVDWDEELGLHQVQQQFHLLLAGVT